MSNTSGQVGIDGERHVLRVDMLAREVIGFVPEARENGAECFQVDSQAGLCATMKVGGLLLPPRSSRFVAFAA
jgi:hypothetical protein